MLHKMTGGAEDEFPEALLPLREIKDEGQKVELTKELLEFVDKAFAAHNRRLDAATVSEALKPIFRVEERTMIKGIFEEKFDEGVAVGRAEGKADALLTILRKKFKKVPKGVENVHRGMTDSIAIESLLAHALDSRTLDEFASALN
jgi:hypothetical protein